MKYLSQFLHQTQPGILDRATRMYFLYTDPILTSAWCDLAKDAQNPIHCCSLFTNQHVRSQKLNQDRDNLKFRIFFHDTFPAKTYFHFRRYVFNAISAGHADDPWCMVLNSTDDGSFLNIILV
jgi:hypothetical protein